MTLEEAIYAHLTDPAAFTAALVEKRVYPLLIPQDVQLDAVAYQRVSGGREQTHDAVGQWARATIQFSCQSTGEWGAKRTATAVRRDLNGFRGLLGGPGGVEVAVARVVNEIDTDELFDAAVCRVDVSFLYKEQ